MLIKSNTMMFCSRVANSNLWQKCSLKKILAGLIERDVTHSCRLLVLVTEFPQKKKF